MPDAISTSYNNTNDTARFFALGPIPRDSFLLSLYGLAYASTAGYFELAHALALQDDADAVAHAAARRLQNRGSIMYNTQPGYQVGTIATAAPAWTVPLNRLMPGGAGWILTRVRHSAGLVTWSVFLTVTWMDMSEYKHIYGEYKPVTIVGAPPPSPPGAPGIEQPPQAGAPI